LFVQGYRILFYYALDGIIGGRIDLDKNWDMTIIFI
jgi:hypothetical protein